VPLATALDAFHANLAQCDSLIANAHRTDTSGHALLPVLDRKQITVAAFLNLFIAWESYLETSLIALLMGSATLSGRFPARYLSPPTAEAARSLIVGVNRYFDYGNHDFFRKMVNMYFQGGYPYEPHLSSIMMDLADIRTMRNASAHITSSTQRALESLALRVLSHPSPAIDLYTFLTALDPRSASGGTVYQEYKGRLMTAAELIVQG
jgi:hypothetical protein